MLRLFEEAASMQTHLWVLHEASSGMRCTKGVLHFEFPDRYPHPKVFLDLPSSYPHSSRVLGRPVTMRDRAITG